MTNDYQPPVTLPPAVEEALRNMSEDDFDCLVARVRDPEEEPDPKVRAARALARVVGGQTKRPRVSKERAAAALASYRRSNR